MRALLVVAAVLLAGCVEFGDDQLYEAAFAGTGGSGGAGEPSFEAVQAVFSASCAFGGCHGGAAPAKDLSLEEGQAFEALLGADGSGGVPSSHASCTGLTLVEPGEPEQSCLWVLVDEGSMPPGGGLSPAAEEAIRGWIAAGALPPGP
ncbi:hypothetical protein [Vulgatibacter sp.]|uniref:hypothetical protein n=1 Tax=Vulgatibacter sp. TaxID=1971226 RepID=UPI003567A370